MTAVIKHIRTPTLEVAYEESGDSAGAPVILLHGWPYDPRCYDGVVPLLVAGGCRVIAPYLRGFARRDFSPPKRYAPASRPRSAMICTR